LKAERISKIKCRITKTMMVRLMKWLTRLSNKSSRRRRR